MNTSLNQSNPKTAWKQEVSRRLVEHQIRRSIHFSGLPARNGEAPVELREEASSRARQAALRVAARYAKVPSYSQMLEDDSRCAECAAETAIETVPEAAEVAVPTARRAPASGSGFDTASGVALASKSGIALGAGPEPACAPYAQPAVEAFISRNPDELAPPSSRHDRGIAFIEPEGNAHSSLLGDSQDVDCSEPLRANLLVFPRELVATRKLRPQRDDAPQAALQRIRVEDQLSIFEVDPDLLSVSPATVVETAASAWPEIELAEEPRAEIEPEAVSEAAALHQAPLGLRLMAIMVDVSLVGTAACTAAVAAAARMNILPGVKLLEAGAAITLLFAGALYQTLFFTLGEATPGMRYAGISLCTFDDQIPTRAQLLGRLGALLLSVLPLGLGIAWALFDEERLSWHDRLSRTYLRKC